MHSNNWLHDKFLKWEVYSTYSLSMRNLFRRLYLVPHFITSIGPTFFNTASCVIGEYSQCWVMHKASFPSNVNFPTHSPISLQQRYSLAFTSKSTPQCPQLHLKIQTVYLAIICTMILEFLRVFKTL